MTDKSSIDILAVVGGSGDSIWTRITGIYPRHRSQSGLHVTHLLAERRKDAQSLTFRLRLSASIVDEDASLCDTFACRKNDRLYNLVDEFTQRRTIGMLDRLAGSQACNK